MMSKNDNLNKNRRGFTLIELLAVIVILAVLMMTAIPAVTQAITKSRKDTYATNAKKFIDAARTSLIDGDMFVKSGTQTTGSVCQTPPTGTYVAISITEGISLERGGTSSSFGKAYKSGYVIVANSGSTTDKFEYYFIGIDEGSNGVEDYVAENNLTRAVVKSGNAADTNIAAVATGPLTLNTKSYTLNAICAEE